MIKKIKEAEIFAQLAHKGQKQVNGKPYIDHPRKVAFFLKKWKQKEEVVIVGLLHDVVEDSGISLNEIETKFGKKVSLLVDGMSWIQNRETGKKDLALTYKKFVVVAKKDPALVLIKAADIKSNIVNILPKDQKYIIKKAIPRNLSFYIPFLKETGFEEIANEVENKYKEFSEYKPRVILFEFISKEDLFKIKKKVEKLLTK